jgi:hypothetical protein
MYKNERRSENEESERDWRVGFRKNIIADTLLGCNWRGEESY